MASILNRERTLTELEFCVSDTFDHLEELENCLKSHISRVDKATKLTQKMPDSQLKRADRALASIQEFRDNLNSYVFTRDERDDRRDR